MDSKLELHHEKLSDFLADYMSQSGNDAVEQEGHGHVVWREKQFIGQKFQKGTCLKCGQESTFLMPPVEFDEIPYCSKCGARLSDDYRDYCPKCGAKLDGEPEHIKAWRPESEEEHNHGEETGNDEL